MPGVEPEEAADPKQRAHKPLRANWTVVGGAALVAAVALVIWLSTPGFVRFTSYQLELVDPKSAAPVGALEGSPPPARVALDPGRGLTFLLRPRTEHTEAVEAMTFLATEAAADAQAVPVVAEAASVGSGGMRLTLRGSALPAWGRLIILVGRRGTVPRSASMGTADHGHGWQRFEIAFHH